MTRRRVATTLVVCGMTWSTMASAQPSLDRSAVSVTRLSDGPTAFSTFTGIDDSIRGVVRDSADWRALWARINRRFEPQPALPAIDFRREMVVVAGLGRRPSGGYDIVIENAEQDSTGIEIALRRASPAPGCPVSAVVTQPLDLARIPASEQPVRFRAHDVIVSCGPR
jgi:hypothetical protein